MLEAFRAVVTTGSMSGAARVLGTTQPNVTRLIRELERDVGFVLLRRHNRGVVPTADGSALYAEVERSFRGLADITRAARDIERFRGGQVSIASIVGPMPRALALVARRWHDLHGELNLTLEFHDDVYVIDWVRSGRFDLGIANPIEEITGVEVLMRRRLSYVAISAPGTSAPSGGVLDLTTLEMPLIVPGAAFLAALCEDREAGTAILNRGRTDVYFSLTAGALAVLGLGVALVDSLTAMDHVARDGATVWPVKQAPHYDIAVIAPSRDSRSRVVSAFAEVLISALNEMLDASENLTLTLSAG